MEEIKEWLVEDFCLTEEEADEIILKSREESIEEIRDVLSVYSSVEELAQHYLDNVVGTIDAKVEDAIDMERLGMNVAKGEEYFVLGSGRVVELEF